MIDYRKGEVVDKTRQKNPWRQFTISSYLTIYHPRSRVLHHNYQKKFIAPSLTSQHIIYHFVGSGTEKSSQSREDQKDSLKARKMKDPTSSALQPPTIRVSWDIYVYSQDTRILFIPIYIHIN